VEISKPDRENRSGAYNGIAPNDFGVPAFFILLFLLNACSSDTRVDKLFTKVDRGHSGINFQNTIEETPEVNIMTYEYAYNGGGVAAADFNNDGFCDLYFSANTGSNKLYLNQGNLKFVDVTDAAGVSGRPLWKTGVTAADVNADGWLDLYVCYSGPTQGQSLSNQLFINNKSDKGGTPTFTESAKEYGLDAAGTYSTQASFFDYDRDGDLDMFLINHGTHFYTPFINTNRLRNMRHPEFGNRLYRNDSETGKVTFTEVSSEAGIHGGGINFSLGVSISDMNNDGWPDIYVTNDYEEQDYLYLNNKDGTFTESTKKSIGHLSRNGMGTDIADFNNDGLPDLIEVDMWPEDNYRQKLLKGPDDFNRYMLMVDSGFHHQQMRNTLQMNAGVTNDGTPIFCEIGQLSGVSATDWSWAPLFADFDNDGLKDLFVSNGYLRDFTSMDFLKYTVEEARRKSADEGKELQVYELVSKMASTRTSNVLFGNNGDLTFSDRSVQWGISELDLSFGAAYADLDNDGDLELITNNTNEPASVWENHASQANHYVTVELKGADKNPFAIGARVVVEEESGVSQMREQFLTRGYQSSVDPILHFGLTANAKTVKKISVTWPDGKESLLTDVKTNQRVVIDYSSASDVVKNVMTDSPKIFMNETEIAGVNFVHKENSFNDFDREPLLPYQLSRLGPALTKADVNGDLIDDFYIGGAAEQSGQLFIGNSNGHFIIAKDQPWNKDAASEDTGATFFDADGDGDQDLFVVSGGNEVAAGSPILDDRLYINNGKGIFKKSESGIIADHASGSCVTAADYDKDGDLDLYVGGRLLPGSFPVTTPGAILKNESTVNGVKFVVATNEVNPLLRTPGMVTDAVWSDFNGDSWPDLIIVGDWMPVLIFENKSGKLVEVKSDALDHSTGLWNRIKPFDYDGDGDLDYLAGNAGNNLPWKVSQDQPLTLYYSDFNDDGRIDPVMSYFYNDREYPVASRDELLLQITSLRKKFLTYAQYGKATIEDIFGKEAVKRPNKLTVETLHSSLIENLGNGKFQVKPLPIDAQLSATTAILTSDFNNDGEEDVLLAGNFYPYRTQYGRSDAGLGKLMLGDGHGKFTFVPWTESGFFASGDIRNMLLLNGAGGKKYILLGRNGDRLELFGFHSKKNL
jgi:enediyne biosynthesis protein E4